LINKLFLTYPASQVRGVGTVQRISFGLTRQAGCDERANFASLAPVPPG
jgi:hypothetical protein